MVFIVILVMISFVLWYKKKFHDEISKKKENIVVIDIVDTINNINDSRILCDWHPIITDKISSDKYYNYIIMRVRNLSDENLVFDVGYWESNMKFESNISLSNFKLIRVSNVDTINLYCTSNSYKNIQPNSTDYFSFETEINYWFEPIEDLQKYVQRIQRGFKNYDLVCFPQKAPLFLEKGIVVSKTPEYEVKFNVYNPLELE